MLPNDTIVALATPSGAGAIALIRVSGENAIEIVSGVFRPRKPKVLAQQKSHTLHLGNIADGPKILDEVLVALFKGPNSYTGEHTVEISCHGSVYLQQQIIQLLLRSGCRSAQAGEFTLRAFLNGKMDLSQAEAVADLIHSDNEAAHELAIRQMRGGFSNELASLRQELLNFASLIELELDFAEEDVEFADRARFIALTDKIIQVLKRLIDSFAVGNVVKNGIPVAIVGAPNVGKSTLLNALLNEDRAIVSDIAGTTRDAIEDEIVIGGIAFRFIDTAGIRETADVVESIGIEKTFQKMEQAQLVLFLVDCGSLLENEGLNAQKTATLNSEIGQLKSRYPRKTLVIVGNKADKLNPAQVEDLTVVVPELHFMSAKTGEGIESLKATLLSFVNTSALYNSDAIVTNTRHYDALLKALDEIQKVRQGLQSGLSGDLLAIDIRAGLYHFGMITGEVTNEELLGNIFANFCIGK